MKNRNAFTLAEVLITLGIIGVVAAMTLPAIIQNYQKMVLRNQFKKAYSTFYTAIMTAQANLGYPVKYSYWDTNPYGSCICDKYDSVYNNCVHWVMPDGSALVSDYTGPRDSADAAAFEDELFNNVLKVVKFCEKNSLANGCITSDYRGTDKIKNEQNSDSDYMANPSSDFSDSNIKNKYSSWVLADGLVIIKYGTYKSKQYPVYTVDINGHKGPNKWGYDIFTFKLSGDYVNGISKITGQYYVTEKGGVSTSQMIEQMYK